MGQAYQNRVVTKGKHGALLVAAAAAITARCGLRKSRGIVGHLPTDRTVCAHRGWKGSHCGLERRRFTLTTYRRGWCRPLRARLRAVMTRDLGLGSVSGWRRQIVPSVVVVVTRLLLQLHVYVSLCLVISGGVVGIIQLMLTFAVTLFDQQLTLLRNALHCAKDVEQLVVARASEVTVRTRQGLALLVTVLPLRLRLHDVGLTVNRDIDSIQAPHCETPRVAYVTHLLVGRGARIVGKPCVKLHVLVVDHPPSRVNVRPFVHRYRLNSQHCHGMCRRLRAGADISHCTSSECHLVQAAELGNTSKPTEGEVPPASQPPIGH